MATSMLRAELLLVAGCLATGFFAAAAYELLLLFRLLLPHGKLLTGIGDVLFFGLAALASYETIYRLGDGIVRYYAALSLAGGAFLWIKIAVSVQKRLQKRRYRRKMKQAKGAAAQTERTNGKETSSS